ncbi:MAG: S41 family peptidase, partial [Bullifex sp.]
EDLRKLTHNGASGLIIDLRNNAGGIVDSATMIANFFLPEGATVLSIQHKEGSSRQNYSTVASNDTRKNMTIPIVILTNGGTASASEILTAALQENGRATVVGSRTFGKGIIQESAMWKNGYIKYTSAYYLTPNGDNIHKTGITPDIEVTEHEYTDEEVSAYYDFIEKSQDEITAYVRENPEYTRENIDAFAALHSDLGIPETALKLLIRNEYIYAMPYNDRPKVDLMYDTALLTAIDCLKGEK